MSVFTDFLKNVNEGKMNFKDDDYTVKNGLLTINDRAYPPEGVICNNKTTIGNADSDAYGYGLDFSFTTSFRCLGRFVNTKKSATSNQLSFAAAKALTSGRLTLVAFTKDDFKKARGLDKNTNVTEYLRNHKPPAPGYSLRSGQWHRPGSSIYHDRVTGNTILMGQDEDTFFGCEIYGQHESVEDAYKALIPEQARSKYVARQGEWFFVPVTEKNLPHVTDCIALTEQNINLPVDSAESARHTVSSGDEILVAKNGQIYAYGPTMTHSNGDHADVRAEGWITFYKNTALRAFSEQGVD